MGDLMEITTWPNHRNIFYRISSNGLIFEVKGHENAAIGLTKKLGTTCDFKVVLGQNHQSWIKKEGGQGATVRTPNIISNTEYRKFWLAWRSGVIQLGRYNNRNPIISFRYKADISYITFWAGNSNSIVPIHWRFELPPLIEKPRLKPVTGGEVQWVNADYNLPDGSLIGGYEKETVYIIRAHHSGSLTPGKFVPSFGLGFVSWGGNSHEKMTFEVLCGYDCTWVPTYEDRIPVGAVEGGYSEDRNREKLYVGRAVYDGHVIPGKVQPSHKVCYIPYENREVAIKKYEILVSPSQNTRCANRLLLDNMDIESPPDSEEDEDPEDEDAEFEEPVVFEVVDAL
ncbi:hypothetical protein evm_000955 [Chilo suppressalis]|nr:hypothetical protein evm_000955 [Chilo suppressalis]